MVEPLRHRQTKEAATDMFNLKQPRHISTLPDSRHLIAHAVRVLHGSTRKCIFLSRIIHSFNRSLVLRRISNRSLMRPSSNRINFGQSALNYFIIDVGPERANSSSPMGMRIQVHSSAVVERESGSNTKAARAGFPRGGLFGSCAVRDQFCLVSGLASCGLAFR
jgi:hypothetical protein